MAINWQELLTNVGTTLASGTVVLGAAAWATKTLLSDRLTRQVEAFKIQLKADVDTANERLKNSLQMVALEHQVRFSKLHEKRAEVIGEVYARLIEVEKGYGRFVLVDGYERDPEKQREARHKTDVAMYEMSLFIEKHRIYLPARVCESLKAFLDIMWDNAIGVGVYGELGGTYATPDTAKERREVFRKATEALRTEIPAARAALEEEFRKLLGVEDSGSENSSPVTTLSTTV
jgi:hypothetical protein